MPVPYTARGAAGGHARAGRAQRPALLLHPPDRLPRLRLDGPEPAGRARRRDDRLLGVGRLSRRGGHAQRHAREGLLVAADQPRLADPAREGLRPVPQQRARQGRVDEGRLRGGDPARRPRPRVRGHRREHLHRRATARSPRPASTTRSSTASRAARSSRSPQDLGYTVVERNVARAEMYLADEVFMSGTAAELVPVRGGRRPQDRHRQARRDHARAAGRLRRRDPRSLRALPRVARRRAAPALQTPSARGPDGRAASPCRESPLRDLRAPDGAISSSTTPPCATAWAEAA